MALEVDIFIDMSGARCSTSGGGKTIGWLCRILCGTYLSGLGGQHWAADVCISGIGVGGTFVFSDSMCVAFGAALDIFQPGPQRQKNWQRLYDICSTGICTVPAVYVKLRRELSQTAIFTGGRF